MAYPLAVDLAGTCSTILANMKDLAKDNYAFMLTSKTGTLDFLTNPINGSVKLDLNNVQQGKKYVKTKVLYKQRTKPCQVLTNAAVGDLCDTPGTPVEKSADVTITQRVGIVPKKFNNSDMINICQDTQAFIREYLVSDMNAMRTKVNEIALAKIAAGIGVNYEQDGTTTAALAYKNVNLLKTPAGFPQAPDYPGLVEVKGDYDNNQLNGYPHLIGQGYLQRFMDLAKYSCCNAGGIAYDSAVAQSGLAYYLDQSANKILGANKFLSLAPNVTHLLWFNENNNININTPLVQHIVIPDPIYPGLKWDFDFKWDECDKAWIYTLSAWFDIFNAYKSDAFGSDSGTPDCNDDLLGMTGIFGYTAVAS